MAGHTKGEIVRHSSRFLKGAGWCFDVPVNGRVIDAMTYPGGDYYRVAWSDGTESSILGVNLEQCPSRTCCGEN